jgi:hypothetical protein
LRPPCVLDAAPRHVDALTGGLTTWKGPAIRVARGRRASRSVSGGTRQVECLEVDRVAPLCGLSHEPVVRCLALFPGTRSSSRLLEVHADCLHLVECNGMHKYSNQNHSMLTAMLTVEDPFGAHHDIWSVSVEEEYHEESRTTKEGTGLDAPVLAPRPLTK